MRRTTIILPALLGEPSILRQRLPNLERIAELGAIFKLRPVPAVETPEALYLGLKPTEGQLHQGPLTISALGADPPERSNHFHLSLLSFEDGVVRIPKRPGLTRALATDAEIAPDHLRQILEFAQKLNTKALTIVKGEGLDHGLVWEALGDLRTVPPSACDGQEMKPNLPEGDGDVALRRFIDDSINLLSELEINQQRIDEGLPPFNLLWPWGQGVRAPVPNLALRRGEPALVMSSSRRLQGLTRLAGYRHVDRRDMGIGTNTRLAKMAELALAEPVSILLIDAVAAFREREMFEEADWFVRELDSVLLGPLLQHVLTNPARLCLLSPSGERGLGATFETGDANVNSTPFDERSLDERHLPESNLWEAVAASLVTGRCSVE